eukprot:NODE_4683_length_1130_cov_103.683217_g4155_i0.p1 GENE.NODE_4683_length_1130_cov_103.683217_g4155_i0~~NODE_4683_length_1130_cov_103.683217_g4155_i0.p1  ORF type:complete len:299 (+),score=77.45 NODE_4683_length_1130_cov_103.683217_g4155_i0:77-973(+)
MEEDLLKTLSQESKDTFQKYFTWAKRKRTLHIKDVEREFAEFKNASLIDDTYNRADVIGLLNDLLAILKVTIDKEQKDTDQAFAEVIRQFLTASESQQVSLHLDLAQLDNPVALGRAYGLEKALGDKLPGLSLAAPLSAKPKPSALAPISATPVPTGPSEREKELEEERERLTEKLNKIQQQYTTMMQEKSKLNQELLKMKELSQSTVSSDALKVKGLEQIIEELKSQLDLKETELSTTQKEFTGKLSESQQFRTLKKLLAQKTQHVKTLRDKLSKYEPEGAAGIELQEEESSSEDDS